MRAKCLTFATILLLCVQRRQCAGIAQRVGRKTMIIRLVALGMA